jgi:hypothetical protein
LLIDRGVGTHGKVVLEKWENYVSPTRFLTTNEIKTEIIIKRII